MKTIKKILKALALLALMLVVPLAGHRAHKHYLYDYKGMSVVRITGELAGKRSGGTGFQVIAPSGKQYTLTNYHICVLARPGVNGKYLEAEDYKGNYYSIKVIEMYKKHDMCLAEAVSHLPALKPANSVINHEQVHLIGHPRLENLTMQTGSVVSRKTIRLLFLKSVSDGCQTRQTSEYNRFVGWRKTYFERYGFTTCIEEFPTIHINVISYGGNSGSPVVDDLGRVIGVLFAGNRSYVTASYIVPLEYVHQFLQDR